MATAEAPRISEYHIRDWWPDTRWFPDMIPLVGFAISSERDRRAKGKSLVETYLPLTKLFSNRTRQEEVDILKYAGTKNWPQPVDRMARLRADAMAARNMLFAGYHAVIPVLGWRYGPDIATAVADHLPKLPLP